MYYIFHTCILRHLCFLYPNIAFFPSLFIFYKFSQAPDRDTKLDMHFVAFVEVDGNLYELGKWKSPLLCRGLLTVDMQTLKGIVMSPLLV